jgi:DNA-binding response OmpR family regulator
VRRNQEDAMLDTEILVIDDDQNICELLKTFLESEGYEVKTANDGVEGLSYFKLYEPDLVLLDIMLPKKDGWAVCREIREMSSKPVIMITAKGEVFDKVLGLELGADDFVVKPFDMKELSARVKAVLRRYSAHMNQNDDEVIKFDNIEISRQKYELRLRGKPVDIPPKELELLYFLASNFDHVFTRDQLLDKVWGFDYLGDSRTVDVHVKRLREKLEGVSDKWTLKTVWGVGYKFELLQ